MVICPKMGTYNHVSIFFLLKNEKKASKLPSRATFAIAKFPYFFRISQLTRKFQFRFYREFFRWWQVQSSVHVVTTRLIWLYIVNLFNNISFTTSTQTWYFRGYDVECEHRILWFAPHTLIFFQNMSDGYVESEGYIITYRYFFPQERKKAFKLPSRATFAIANFTYLFRISQLTQKFQFLSRIFQMVTVHLTTRLTLLELTHSSIFRS